MASRVLLLASIAIACIAVHATPLVKRANHAELFDGHKPLQGVEVNGLFNPMQSITPQLFERASEEHGNTLTTYHDICKLLPQDKLDAIMADHYSTFITDYDLGSLKNAHIHSLRIPVSYNVFLPEANRTDNFPHGQKRALDQFIQRVLDYDMTVWLDLIAIPNNHLGKLEVHGNEITPEIAKKVIKTISKKYDSRDVTTILVHPDITYPSKPSNLPPLDSKSIKKTKNSQYTLYKELSSILSKKGHLLAIDTTKNLEYWGPRMASLFSEPVVLVHSLQTGLVSTRQRSVQRLMSSIREDMMYLKDLAEDIPVAVTWDASINSCTEEGQKDCSITGQLWQAMETEPNHSDDEGILNDYTENFGLDVLKELDKANIAAWFFRTAKIQSDPSHTENSRQLMKRKARRPEQVISGNDFLSMYRHGIFTKKTFKPGRKHGKGVAPLVLGLGATAAVGGAGALGWWFWDDIKKTVSDLVQSITLDKTEDEVNQPLLGTGNVKSPATVQSTATGEPSPQQLSPQRRTRITSEDLSPEGVIGFIEKARPLSSLDSIASSLPNDYPPTEPLNNRKSSDPANRPAPAPEPFDFPFAQFPEVDWNDEDALLPVQPYRNPNRKRPTAQPELVPDEEEASPKYPKSPFSDPKIFQEGLKRLNRFNPPSPEKIEAVRESLKDSLKVHVSEPSIDSELFEPISPVGEYETDYFPHFVDTSFERAPQGTIDKSRPPPVDEIVSKLEDPPKEKPPPSVVVDIPNDSSVRDSVSRFESAANSPDTSRRTSQIFDTSPLESKRSSYSEFGLSKPLTDKKRKLLRPLAEIQQDLIDYGIPKREWVKPLNIPKTKRPLSDQNRIGDKRHGRVVSVGDQKLLDKMLMGEMREEQKDDASTSNVEGMQMPSTTDDHHPFEKPDLDAAPAETQPEEPAKDKSYNPEPLTHVQQEQYTRPHAGTGGGSPVISEKLTKVRKDTDIKRRASPEPRVTIPMGHHVIGGEHARPMKLHAPRHKEMDPNHPQNLKRMKPKSDEYVPYPPPQAKHHIRTHHMTTEKVTTTSKGPFALPKTVVTHHKEETHLQPDMATAWQTVGHDIPDAPKSGIGKDPRKDFEDEQWTEEEKAGHRAYVETVRKCHLEPEKASTPSPKVRIPEEEWRVKVGANWKKTSLTSPAVPVEDKRSVGRVKELTEKWTNSDKFKGKTEAVKPKEISPKSGKVSEMANALAAKASANNEDRLTKLDNLAQSPGKVNKMAKLWTNMERKGSAPSSTDHSASLQASKSSGAERIKALKDKTTAPEVLEKSAKDTQSKAPSLYESVWNGIKKKQERHNQLEPNSVRETAEAPSSYIELMHLTKNRARPPKKNRISDA